MPQAFGHGRQPGIRIVESLQGRIGTVLCRAAPGLRGGEGETLAFQLGGHRGKPRGRVVDGGLHLDQRGSLGGASVHGQGGQDVPGPGHGGQFRAAGKELRRLVQALDDDDARQQFGQGQPGGGIVRA